MVTTTATLVQKIFSDSEYMQHTRYGYMPSSFKMRLYCSEHILFDNVDMFNWASLSEPHASEFFSHYICHSLVPRSCPAFRHFQYGKAVPLSFRFFFLFARGESLGTRLYLLYVLYINASLNLTQWLFTAYRQFLIVQPAPSSYVFQH